MGLAALDRRSFRAMMEAHCLRPSSARPGVQVTNRHLGRSRRVCMGLQFTYLPDFPQRRLDGADLARCETDLGVALPQELRAFLLAHDGPVPEPAWIRLEVDGEQTWLGPVHSLKSVMGPPDHRSRGNSIEAE